MRILSERAGLAMTLTVSATALSVALAAGTASAEKGEEAPLSLWASDAPLASVLEQVVGSDVFDVRVGEGVEGLVSGRLEGSVSDVLEPLLDRYALSLHNDGSTVWFDRRDREVTELVTFDPEREPALASWAARELVDGSSEHEGRVSREKDGLRLSGTRSFVQSTLERIGAARSVLGENGTTAASADAADDPEDFVANVPDISGADGEPAGPRAATASPLPEWREPVEALSMPDADTVPEEETVADGGPPFRSVTDIPGFHTEYR